MSGSVRAAAHAGSWYSDDSETLTTELDTWLNATGRAEPVANLKAVIVPHAGFRYSGATAAYSYAAIDATAYDRIYVLGPSHHCALGALCAAPVARRCATPVGTLRVDTDAVRALIDQDEVFETMSLDVDEAEHSIEMQFPFLARVFAARLRDVRFVPLMVSSSLDPERHTRLAAALRPAFEDARTLFVISSDFCHWGARFDYRPHDASRGAAIWQSIEALDRDGMALIEARDADGFWRYLRRTHNTICGRHPISVLLRLLADTGDRYTCQFVRYAQSSRVEERTDSSVSYAAAHIVEQPIQSSEDQTS
jgi:AmmeMemoRadiSam system protein B